MSDYFLPFLIGLVVLAALLRDNFVFTLLYLFAGIYFLGRWWSERALRSITYQREFPNRVFFGEEIPVRLAIRNSSWLPAVWVRLNEGVPLELSAAPSILQVLSIGPRGRNEFHYTLSGKKRGYYPIGPLHLTSGDVFGFWLHRRIQEQPDHLTVYPKIIPLHGWALPSRIPLGSLAYTQPIFEDPNRFIGKRDYVVGDSLRRVDWKTTASRGSLQVKLYEPSITIETAIFLSLNPNEYYRRRRFQAIELAIITAASIANWVVERRQAVGLVNSGADPFSPDLRPVSIGPRKGRGHLMRILETLARVDTSDRESIADLIRREGVHCSWGTTLIVITGQVDDRVFDELLRAKRRGILPLLVLIDLVESLASIRERADQSGIPLVQIYDEQDLKSWHPW